MNQPKCLSRVRYYGSNLLASIILGMLVTVTSVSYASLIYTSSLTVYLIYGLSASLIGSVILLIIVALTSSSVTTIASPQDTFAIAAALVAAAIAKTIQYEGVVSNPVPTIVCSMMLMTFLLGLSMFFLGVMKLGRLVHYIPYPVVGGFLAGTGWLIFIGTLETLTDTHSIIGVVIQLLSGNNILVWLLPLCFAITIIILEHYFGRKQILQWMLLLGFMAFYVYLLIFHIPLQQIRQIGWMVISIQNSSLLQIPSFSILHDIQWHLLIKHIPDYFAVIILGLISMLLNISSFEVISKNPMDINKELQFTGIANCFITLFGGLGGYQVLSFSKTNLNFGTKTRLVGVLAGLICFIIILFGTTILMFLPKFIFGICLFHVSLNFMKEWLIDVKNKVSRSDYFILLCIVGTIIFWGLLVGIIVGLLLSLSIFFFCYSRIPVISSIQTGIAIRSNVERSEIDKNLLEKYGDSLLVINVRGYLFFGNSYDMVNNIIKLFEDTKADNKDVQTIRYLVINFSQATGIEASGAMSFINLLHRANQKNIIVIFSNLPHIIAEEIKLFVAAEHDCLSFESQIDLDHALAWCESQLLASCPSPRQYDPQELFTNSFPNVDNISGLLMYADKLVFNEGDIICLEGDTSRDMYWILEGAVEVMLHYRTPSEKRLKEVLAGNLIGEMALYLNESRSASIIVAKKSILYRFTEQSILKLTEDSPLLAAELHKSVVCIIAKRLIHSNQYQHHGW